ncbi:GNAT family N-acetyltransferase [Desulfogranum japonicum]|uniref:GNAT family N-acetyltransferase n=1 Tax=Desulfogranum japonicum TaxID=231447 RepID=UPI00040B4330|nr:GNAT family N-acetyltransferase [Desulfogranum japonicum]
MATEKEYFTLLHASTDATIFNEWSWVATQQQHNKEDSHLFITYRRKNSGELIAFFAFSLCKEILYTIPVTVCRFLQYPYGDRIGMLIHPDHLHIMETCLADITTELSSHFDIIMWDQWTDTIGLLSRARQWALRNNQKIHIKNTCNCPVVRTKDITKKELDKVISSKSASRIRRLRKKLNNLSHRVVLGSPDPDKLDGILHQIMTTESASWKGEQGVGLFSSSTGAEFFREISHNLMRNNQLFICLLYMDKTLVAYRYGFLFRNTFFDYSLAYLPQYGHLSPGIILLDALFDEAIQQRFEAVDASRVGKVSQNPIKKWATFYIDHYRFYWFGHGLRATLLFYVISNLKPWIKNLQRFTNDLCGKS